MKQTTGEQLRDLHKAFSDPLQKRIAELEAQVEALKQDQRNYLHEVSQGQAEIAALKAKSFVPVSWQFFQDGQWWNGDDLIKDHRKNTVAAGQPVRDLYAVHPKSDLVLMPRDDVFDYISLLITEAEDNLTGRHQPERQARLRADIERVRALLGGERD